MCVCACVLVSCAFCAWFYESCSLNTQQEQRRMVEKEKAPSWLGTDFKTLAFVHLLTLSVVVNGMISNGAPHEVDISTRNLEEVSHVTNNRPIHNITSPGFDEARMPEKGVEEGGRTSSGRSLRFKLGERFAFRRRLQFALLPIMYKMGVMTTLLTGLTVLVLKGLTIGVILLIFAFGNYFTKLNKHSYQSAQPIHVHVHSQDGHSKVTSFPSSIGPWDRVADEVHPSAFLGEDDLESYRRRLIQNSAAMVKFKPLMF